MPVEPGGELIDAVAGGIEEGDIRRVHTEQGSSARPASLQCAHQPFLAARHPLALLLEEARDDRLMAPQYRRLPARAEVRDRPRIDEIILGH